MGDAGFFKGTSSEQDTRFKDKEKSLLKSINFPKELDQKVNMRKVELSVMKPWISDKIIELLGFEDEVVVEYVHGLLDDPTSPIVDPKKMQINLTGFLESKTGAFMSELWALLLSAQQSPLKIPALFIEQKKEEMRKKEEADLEAQAAIKRRQEQEEENERRLAEIRRPEIRDGEIAPRQDCQTNQFESLHQLANAIGPVLVLVLALDVIHKLTRETVQAPDVLDLLLDLATDLDLDRLPLGEPNEELPHRHVRVDVTQRLQALGGLDLLLALAIAPARLPLGAPTGKRHHRRVHIAVTLRLVVPSVLPLVLAIDLDPVLPPLGGPNEELPHRHSHITVTQSHPDPNGVRSMSPPRHSNQQSSTMISIKGRASKLTAEKREASQPASAATGEKKIHRATEPPNQTRSRNLTEVVKERLLREKVKASMNQI
ncbi:hypothetical protein PCANC_04568 [Puccinia coronata f. sp. avenae]|uniref:PWI domain-containing protein n=1 Tax=Puccinia coronata f. sp. avenae TaxID=200324 RepID=A0A2N5W0B8_9BASI|nr:hypothetical protein PCANC_04568 [Puccinia coronata f. sp. avenae]